MIDNTSDIINGALDNILNSRLINCKDCSSNVMRIYRKLLLLVSRSNNNDMSNFEGELSLLKELLIEEYNAYEKLLYFDRNRLIPKLDLNINESTADFRYSNQLQSFKNIFMDFVIKSNELKTDVIPDYIHFDLHSMILTIIHIDTFKQIKGKIDHLTFDNKKDAAFVQSLYNKLNLMLLKKCCTSDSLSFITVFNNMDIDKISSISMDLITSKLSIKQQNIDVSSHISEILMNLIIELISTLSVKKNLDNEPADVFNYLFLITKMDVAISYMNKEYLLKLQEYFKNIKFDNSYIHNDIDEKISKRISNI